MDKIAIAILNWNGEKLLNKFLPSVIKHSNLSKATIYVIDNASTDHSVELLNRKFPEVKLIQLEENFGYAGGYNKGLAQIDAEYYVLLNSDVEVTANWLKPMSDFLDENEDVVAIQPKILSYNNKTMFEYAGAAGGFIDSLGYPFCRGRIFDTLESDNGQYNPVVDIFWASGACFMIRSADFNAVGGFDASFFAHMEEIDLCWRLKKVNRRIVSFPKTVVYHLGGATLDSDNPQKVYLNFRNNMLMLYKNLSEEELQPKLKQRLRYNKLAQIVFYLTGKTAKAKAIGKAHQDFFQMKENYKLYREETFNPCMSSLLGVYPGNIIKDYYLSKKKQFGDLLFTL